VVAQGQGVVAVANREAQQINPRDLKLRQALLMMLKEKDLGKDDKDKGDRTESHQMILFLSQICPSR